MWLASVFGAAVLTMPALVLVATGSPRAAALVGSWPAAGSSTPPTSPAYSAAIATATCPWSTPWRAEAGPCWPPSVRWCCWASGPAPWRSVGGAVVVLAILSLAAPAVRAGAPGADWALATGLTIAVYTLWDKHAVGTLDASPVVYFWATEIGVALCLSPFVLSRPETVRKAWRVDRRSGARSGPALGLRLHPRALRAHAGRGELRGPRARDERAGGHGARGGRAARGRPAPAAHVRRGDGDRNPGPRRGGPRRGAQPDR